MKHTDNGPVWAQRCARFIAERAGTVLVVLLLLGALGAFGASRLTINSNQLDLISQDLREVKDVKRVIDMVGGNGFLMLALRSDDEATMKAVADDLADRLSRDQEHVRSVTYRIPVEFVQQNIGLFVQTEDLLTFKQRVDAYLKAQVRAANPFFVRLREAKAPTLQIDDLVGKYGQVGQKSIVDDYYLSHDHKMLLLLIKPRWDNNDLAKTHAYLAKLREDLANYANHSPRGVSLVEDYERMGDAKTVAYGFTGSYKTSLDDSYAIKESLEPVSYWAFGSIFLITIFFFRKVVPTLIVMSGMALGTVMTMGFCRASVGQLNMITSILGGILMGFGVDYGIHFIFRTRIELGQGKRYDVAVRDALVAAGRPAAVAAVVTGGSFMTLMASKFLGFSQFGFLAGCGTLIIGATMFAWSAAWVCLLGRLNEPWLLRAVGTMPLPGAGAAGAGRVPRPRALLAVCGAVVAAVCALAVPWQPNAEGDGFAARLLRGVRFNYNSRALMAENQPSVRLQDEISARYKVSSDPVAVYTKDLAEAKVLYEEMTAHPEKYPSVAQVMSIYTFVPPPTSSAKNAEIMHAWHQELDKMDLSSLEDAERARVETFKQALLAKPFPVEGVPALYADQFRNLPETRPENRGYLTYLYPRVDLWDGQQMLKFADEVGTITAANGHAFHAAGAALLYAQLARTVLFDGKLTLVLAAVWILLLHYLDFRSALLATASVLPLGLGLGMMLGLMALTQHPLNFMNIIMLPILLGFGVSHGLYLLHRFLEGTKTTVALRSVGAAVISSTGTAIAGFASLFAASHQGLRSMGYVACLGLTTTLIISFTVLAAVLQILEDRRGGRS